MRPALINGPANHIGFSSLHSLLISIRLSPPPIVFLSSRLLTTLGPNQCHFDCETAEMDFRVREKRSISLLQMLVVWINPTQQNHYPTVRPLFSTNTVRYYQRQHVVCVFTHKQRPIQPPVQHNYRPTQPIYNEMIT